MFTAECFEFSPERYMWNACRLCDIDNAKLNTVSSPSRCESSINKCLCFSISAEGSQSYRVLHDCLFVLNEWILNASVVIVVSFDLQLHQIAYKKKKNRGRNPKDIRQELAWPTVQWCSIGVKSPGCRQGQLLLHCHHHYYCLHPLTKPTAERNMLTQQGGEGGSSK